MSERARSIKLADRLDNMRKMLAWDRARQDQYARVTRELLEALKPWPLPVLAEKIEAHLRYWDV